LIPGGSTQDSFFFGLIGTMYSPLGCFALQESVLLVFLMNLVPGDRAVLLYPVAEWLEPLCEP
jgi:hypothetical protein